MTKTPYRGTMLLLWSFNTEYQLSFIYRTDGKPGPLMVMFSGHLYKLLQPITVSCKIQNPNSGKQGREAEPACLDSCASYCRCLLEPNKTIYCFKGFISPPCPRFFIARDFLWLWRASVPRLYTLCCHYAQCCSPIVIVMLCCLVGIYLGVCNRVLSRQVIV